MQVWLPAATKANTQVAGADIKQSGLFRCWPSGRWRMYVSKPISWEDGGLMSQSLSPPLSGGTGLKRGRGEQNKEIKGGGRKVLYT